MVKPRRAEDTIRSEFADGLLPGLTNPLVPEGAESHGDKGTNPRGDKSANPLGASAPNPHGTLSPNHRPSRRKVAFYLDTPGHLDLIDELLGHLRRVANLPRDQSMLIRALLDRARQVLSDPALLQALADACAATLPNR